jgi:AcrR family transcriptional regulator
MSHTETVKAENKNGHQTRTDATRERVLAAAEKVFVLEGFEGAEIETIAKVAGRTKGSVYANFKNKEDLFLAVCEKRSREHLALLLKKVKDSSDRAKAIEAFKKFIIGLASDRAWPLLMLEFKLYSLRHPEARERWVPMNEKISLSDQAAMVNKMFGKLSAAKERDLCTNLAAIGPLLSGLILEVYFEPEFLTPKRLTRLMDNIMTALLRIS